MARERVNVTDYWRVSPRGRLHHVGKYDRSVAMRAAGDKRLPTVGKAARRAMRRVSDDTPIVGRPWGEAHYVLRWRDGAGRKHGQFITRAEYEALRAACGGEG